MQKTHKTHGLWPSPFTPELISNALDLSEPQWDKVCHQLVWLEQRDGVGRLVAMDSSGNCPRELTIQQNVRARVGYGGGNFCAHGGVVVFVGNEGKLYRQSLREGHAVAITPGFGQCASPRISPNGEWVVYVYDNEGESGLALVPLSGNQWPMKLVTGADFYMDPRWSADGKWMSWVCWNHPNMPWEGSFLQLAPVSPTLLSQSRTGKAHTIAGGNEISIIQPEFSPSSDQLVYLSDESGWYNLHCYHLKSKTTRALTQESAELGGPAWILGMRWYDWMPDGKRLAVIRSEQGFSSLQILECATGEITPWPGLQSRYSHLESICISAKGEAVLLASHSHTPKQLIKTELNQEKHAFQILKRSFNEQISTDHYSIPEALQAKNERGQVIHGLFYSPQHPRFECQGLPPLVLRVHGGPTSQALPNWNGEAQYFTSRGYALLDLNYRGSSGYGKSYRDLLRGNWGVSDVEDAIFMASYLVEQKRADAERLVIKGGSAGGYTVLQVMVRHPGVFCAGICSYGISNMFNLVQDTHKFEKHYTDSLIGVLPEAAPVFHERSPLFFANRIQRPLLLFQGDEDRVVPKNQTESMVEVLRQNKIPHEYHLFAGEGHGWRKQETINRYYQATSAFLEKYVIFSV